jgi:hypothetical protein
VALGDDLLADRCIERAVYVVQQQRARIALSEAVDQQRWEPSEGGVAIVRSLCTDECDPLREEPPSDETEDLCGRVVEPLRVVDDADERLLLGDLGEKRQRSESNEESIGCRAGV